MQQENGGLGRVMTSIVALEIAREDLEKSFTENSASRAKRRIADQEERLKALRGPVAWDW